MKYHEKFIAGDSRTKGSLFFYARPPPDTGCGNCMKQNTYSFLKQTHSRQKSQHGTKKLVKIKRRRIWEISFIQDI